MMYNANHMQDYYVRNFGHNMKEVGQNKHAVYFMVSDIHYLGGYHELEMIERASGRIFIFNSAIGEWTHIDYIVPE